MIACLSESDSLLKIAPPSSSRATAAFPFRKVRPLMDTGESTALFPSVMLKMRDASLPLTEMRSAPGPLMVSGVVMSRSVPLSTISPTSARSKMIVSLSGLAFAASMASRSVVFAAVSPSSSRLLTMKVAGAMRDSRSSGA